MAQRVFLLFQSLPSEGSDCFRTPCATTRRGLSSFNLCPQRALIASNCSPVMRSIQVEETPFNLCPQRALIASADALHRQQRDLNGRFQSLPSEGSDCFGEVWIDKNPVVPAVFAFNLCPQRALIASRSVRGAATTSPDLVFFQSLPSEGSDCFGGPAVG